MSAPGGFVLANARKILQTERYALFAVIFFMLMPYFAWLSVAVVALVTLKNGWRQGLVLVLPAMTTHMVVLLWSTGVNLALLDSCFRVIPCYIAANVLRETQRWRMVSLFFLVLTACTAAAMHGLFPKFVGLQYVYFQAYLKQMDGGSGALNILDQPLFSVMFKANLLFGIQELSMVVVSLISLLFARSMQSKLVYPEGFRQELLNYRGDWQTLFILLALMGASYSGNAIAINSLPLTIFYFVLFGLSFAAHVFSQMKPFRVLILLGLPCVLLPLMALPFYMMLGCFDSVFNFRLFLSSNSGKKS